MSFSASTRNILAAIPGLDFIPAPTRVNLADLVIGGHRAEFQRAPDLVERVQRTGKLIKWQRERQVGATIGSHVLDDGVDVDQRISEHGKDPRRDTRLVVDPVIVILASSLLCAMPDTIACSMSGVSLVIQVPSSGANDERTCSGTS